MRDRHKRPQETPATESSENFGGVEIAGNPFQADFFVHALRERGVLLAPLIVQWTYHVPAQRPFAKWIKTKDILLSRVRLGNDENTSEINYLGTYIAQNQVERDGDALQAAVECQTIWGFSSEAAMVHMFDLCRGKVERVSIVQNDLLDFVAGLKAHIREAGAHRFKQTVLVAPAAL